MNWKQLYTLATPEERLDLALRMIRRIEARHEVVIVAIDLRRILMRSAFLGILGMLTFTTAIITAQADPALAAPTLTAYLMAFFAVFAFKSKKTAPLIHTAHYV